MATESKQHLQRALVAGAFLLVGIIVFVLALNSLGNDTLQETPGQQKRIAHYYKKPEQSLARVHLKIFYAVPQNRVTTAAPWKENLETALTEMKAFHRLQFRNLSELSYDIYPEPVVLENQNIFYDTEQTDRGNPEALRRIVPELEERYKDFMAVTAGEFAVTAIIYEGVGGSGAPGALLLSRTFLTDEQYRPFRSTLLYHEFGHTMGLPDEYDLETNEPFSDDIMGAGRRKPLSQNYLDSEKLQELGVIGGQP